jgi:hypothetical protein
MDEIERKRWLETRKGVADELARAASPRQAHRARQKLAKLDAAAPAELVKQGAVEAKWRRVDLAARKRNA